ncbi:MAG: DUF748 domain-containing protein [Dysgonomonas sp.]
MTRKKRKKWKVILIIFSFIFIGGIVLNWFLTTRLESFLREKLSEEVSNATNGFYRLSYDKLSIGFLNGELKIEGLELCPDSTVFKRLSLKDSLPDTYFNIHIDTIDFKGVNLTWRVKYRKLHFDLFEIKSPDILIYNPYIQSDQNKEDSNSNNPTNLYELVSPFFDVISVKQLNLENASVSYSIQDSIVPAVYSLKDVSFHAYDFLLDENSSKSGKLLYCDNFDFTTNQSQQLLSNNQFTLNVATISLNTRDSIINIEDVSLLPQKDLWKSINRVPEDILTAKVNGVKVHGIDFKRENGLNFLHARSFNIMYPDIQYFKIDTLISKVKRHNKNEDVTLLQTWSLYNIISPILNRASIDVISLQKTKMDYSTLTEKGLDKFHLGNFDFKATNFLVDSLPAPNHNFLYSDNFAFSASDINIYLKSKNHELSIKNISLDTEKGVFDINDIELSPISTKTRDDYVQGYVDSVNINGLEFNRGLKARLLKIESPDIKYFKYFLKPVQAKKEEDKGEEGKNITVDLFTSYFNFVAVDDIRLNNANFVYNDREMKNTSVYKIRGLNFYASDFLIDDSTRLNYDWQFAYSNYGFNLKNFDNYLANDKYRLIVKDISFDGFKGLLKLKNIDLIPQEQKWKESPDSYMSLNSPSIYVDGIKFDKKIIKVSTVNLETPNVRITKVRNSKKERENKRFSSDPLNIFFTDMFLGKITTDNINLQYIDKTKNDSLNTLLKQLEIKDIYWNITEQKKIKLGDVSFINPQIIYITNSTKKRETTEISSPDSDNRQSAFIDYFQIGKFKVSDLKIAAKTPESKTDMKMKLFQFSGLDWKLTEKDSYFKLDDINIQNPVISAQFSNIKTEKDTIREKDKRQKASSKNIYSTLQNFSDKITIGKFNLNKADLDYSFVGVEKKEQKINSFDLNIKGLSVDNRNETFRLDDINFSTKDLSFPIANGYYTINIDSIGMDEDGKNLEINNLHMKSLYPKMEFAYKHPTHKDWFDVKVGNAKISGIDIPYYFSDNILKIADVRIDDVSLENFKNQKIEIQHNIMPMIYEGIQKAPIKFEIGNMNVNNFSVVYEELAKKGETPGKIFFTDMNGHITGMTNIISQPEQYIRLDADGKLMGSGYFTATWQLPVDPGNDRFLLNADIHEFDLTELNEIITPLAPVKLKSGILNSTKFDMDASSKGGNIKLTFLYNDLNVDILKEKNGELVQNKLVSNLVNMIARDHNPRNKKSEPKSVDIYVERDPYHSTFNYLLQIIQPAMAESAGVSYGTQKFVKNLPNFFKKMSDFFWPVPKKEEEENTNN